MQGFKLSIAIAQPEKLPNLQPTRKLMANLAFIICLGNLGCSASTRMLLPPLPRICLLFVLEFSNYEFLAIDILSVSMKESSGYLDDPFNLSSESPFHLDRASICWFIAGPPNTRLDSAVPRTSKDKTHLSCTAASKLAKTNTGCSRG